MKVQIKYCLLAVFVLLSAANIVIGKPVCAKVNVPEESTISDATEAFKIVFDAADAGNVIKSDYLLSDLFSVTHTPLGTSNLASKRVQSSKQILLLHAASLSKTVRVFHNRYIFHTNQLTHIYLFLFPYHYYW